MNKSRKAIATIITLLMCLGILAACGGDGGGGPAPVAPSVVPQVPASPVAPDAEGSIAAPAPADPTAVYRDHIDMIIDNNNIAVINPFNPASQATSTQWVFTMIHDRLIERNETTGEFVSFLATDWSTDDYQTFIFDLRDDVYFHSGEKFTAEDVKYTIEYANEHGIGSPANAQWRLVETVNVISPTRVEVILEQVFVDFFHNISISASSIVSKAAMEADTETGPYIGSGPYMIDHFEPNDYVRMVRNDNYWNDNLNIVTPTVTFRFVPEMSARTIRMQTGESQLSHGTSADDVALFQADPDNFQVFPHTYATLQGYSMNMSDPLLSDKNLRFAIMHATDRAEISIMAAGEWCAPITQDQGGGTVWGYATEFRNNNIPMLEFDQDLAREYLAASSYDGEEIEIAAAIITNIRAAQALQQQLAAVGINTRIAEFDSPGLSAYMMNPESPTQLVFISLTMNSGAGSMRNLIYPGAVQNTRMQYNNPEVTEILDRATGELDTNARRDLYMRLQEIVAEDPPFLQTYWRINAVVAAEGIGGVRLNSDNLQTDMRQMYQIIGYE